MQYKTDVPQGSAAIIDGVSGHLLHPRLRGMPGDPRQCDASRFQMKKEQNVVGGQATPRQYFNGEEIDSRHYGHVRTNEVRPCCGLAALRSRRNPKPPQNVADRLIGDLMTEVAECSGDAVVTPKRILSRHADDQFHDLASDPWPPRIQPIL